MKRAIIMFTLLLLSVISADAQIRPKVDEFTGDTTWGLSKPLKLVTTTGVGFYVDVFLTKARDAMIMSLYIKGSGCIDAKAKVYFIYADSSTSTEVSHGKFNCDAYVSFYFTDRDDILLGNIITSKVRAIRVTATSGYAIVRLSEGQGDRLSKDCELLRAKMK